MRHISKASILLSTHAWKAILLDAYQRQQIEACGALLGKIDGEGNWHVEEVLPLHNIAASPVYFEFEPSELLTIDLEQPGRMIGVYHSHPTGPDIASSTDCQNMQRVNREQHIPWVWLIVSGPFTNQPASNSLASEGAAISARGAIAYHHYQDTGLQQIAIQRSEREAIEPV
ncbi:MAG: M67 family metallopeptidase [Ktedonobacteraceae bacterium]